MNFKETLQKLREIQDLCIVRKYAMANVTVYADSGLLTISLRKDDTDSDDNYINSIFSFEKDYPRRINDADMKRVIEFINK